jgi:hygromycin-B 7''-O-kinase
MDSLGPPEDLVRDHWSSIFTDAQVWRPLIEEIWRREGLGAVGAVDGGLPGSNAVFRVNAQYWVKIAWPRYMDDLAREAEILGMIGDSVEIPAPRPIARDVLHGTMRWEYLVMTHVPGHSIGEVRHRVPRRDLEAIAETAGAIIRAIHDLPRPTPPSTLPLDPDSWPGFIDGQIAAAPQRHSTCQAMVPYMDELPEFLAAWRSALAESFVPTVIHADITADHIMVAERAGRWEVTGIIDLGDVEVGHRDYEWVAVHLDCLALDQPLMRRLLDAYGYGPDESLPPRLLALTLLHRFADMEWLGTELPASSDTLEGVADTAFGGLA